MITMSFCRLSNSLSNSTWLECFDSLSCIFANRKRKPPTASHNLSAESSHYSLLATEQLYYFALPRMCQSLLVQSARTLNHLTESVEHLTSHTYSLQEIAFAGRIDDFFAGIVPIEIHNRFLQKENCRDKSRCTKPSKPSIRVPEDAISSRQYK